MASVMMLDYRGRRSHTEVTPVSEIGPYRFTPSTISETEMNDYMKEAYPAAVAAE